VPFEIGRAITLRQGDDITLISTGGMLPVAMQVAERLIAERFAPRVLSMHTVKPLDVEAVLAAGRETRGIITLEEHSVVGGLGSAVAEVLAESADRRVPFKRLGLPAAFTTEIGDQDYLRAVYGLSEDGVLRALKPFLDLIRRQEASE
jgi:transketolase